MPAFEITAALIEQLNQSDDYRVLRRMTYRPVFNAPDGGPIKQGLVVDTETTGMSAADNAIIQFCGIPFTYNPQSGKIYEVRPAITYFEEPKGGIPPEITELTGITNDEVKGQRLDDRAIEKAVNESALIIAHNAAFDRPFLEKRLPIFKNKDWACSYREIPWPSGSAKLEYLVFKQCRLFFGAHRADADCLAVLELLATSLDGQHPLMHVLLRSAEKPTYKIWADGAPFDRKDALKARHYHWNDGTDGKPKAWCIELADADKANELQWLMTNVYGGKHIKLTEERYTARNRYSAPMA